ncbi:hypothetical protein [Cryptosporangium japonicum]|uniref:Uncharacterized protein n=1 Tax=Cryptosporangium japonicum TaxID=80872 RepID=A0ABN0V0F3_9ACTN
MSAALSARSDADLAALLETAPADAAVTLRVDGVRIFAKRIPLTDRERARPGDTGNLFDLPTFCQYGIGSPGFGAWRELAANRFVSAAVRAGRTSALPLLHHWRVLPGRPPMTAEFADVDAAAARLGRARLDEDAARYVPGNVPPAVAAILARHAPAAATTNDFYWRLFGGDVHAAYPGVE